MSNFTLEGYKLKQITLREYVESPDKLPPAFYFALEEGPATQEQQTENDLVIQLGYHIGHVKNVKVLDRYHFTINGAVAPENFLIYFVEEEQSR